MYTMFVMGRSSGNWTTSRSIWFTMIVPMLCPTSVICHSRPLFSFAARISFASLLRKIEIPPRRGISTSRPRPCSMGSERA